MAASFALSWNRPAWAAKRLNKPEGRAVSPYRIAEYDKVEAWATHINALCPDMDCGIEVFTS